MLILVSSLFYNHGPSMDDSILNIIIIIIIIFFFIIEHLTFADCQNIQGERYTL